MRKIDLTAFAGAGFSGSFFVTGMDFSVSLLFSGAWLSHRTSFFAPAMSSKAFS